MIFFFSYRDEKVKKVLKRLSKRIRGLVPVLEGLIPLSVVNINTSVSHVIFFLIEIYLLLNSVDFAQQYMQSIWPGGT